MAGTAARTVSVLALLGTLLPPAAGAFDFGNMMSPGRWFNGNRDDYNNGYDDYYGPPGPGYAYPGTPGYYPGYGYTAPGYGVPAYGAPTYAAPYGAPRNAVTPPSGSVPSGATDADAAEIARLKKRVQELEKASAAARSTAPASPAAAGQPAPAPWGSTSSGASISTWQTPMAPTQPADTPAAAPSSPDNGDRAAPSSTGSAAGGWQPANPPASQAAPAGWNKPSGANGNYGMSAPSTAGSRRLTTQYPGQETFDIGH
jgi:hypothetical protein